MVTDDHLEIIRWSLVRVNLAFLSSIWFLQQLILAIFENYILKQWKQAGYIVSGTWF